MGPKPCPTPKPHARSVASKINKVASTSPKPFPVRPPPPRSLETLAGSTRVSSSSNGETQVLQSRPKTIGHHRLSERNEIDTHPVSTQIPSCLNFPLIGPILPVNPTPLGEKSEAGRSIQAQRLLDLFTDYADISTVAHQLQQSKFPEMHLQHMLHNIEPETAKRHINKFLHFTGWLQFDGAIGMDQVQPFHIADYLMDTIPAKKNSEWRFKPAISSLTWISKILGLQQLATSLESDLIKGFFASKGHPPLNPSIIPVSLGMAYILETHLLNSPDSIATIPLGSFLLMFWSGLRFSDVQRTWLADINLTDGILRGKTWRSKSLKKGMAFSCITAGLAGTHSRNWATTWLHQLKLWWSKLGDEWQPDFLVPVVHPKSGVAKPQPMAHYQAAIWLRIFLDQREGIKPTLHGLKAGLVAVGKQLTLPDEWLSEQAHHAPKNSTATYTRDDTYFQLRLQVTIMQYLQKGWRPMVPQFRGSNHPIADTPFECADWLTWDWLFPNSPSMQTSLDQRPRATKVPKEVEEVDSSSSSSSTESSDSESETSENVFLLNNFNTVAHSAIKKGNEIQPASGASLGLPDRVYIQSKTAPADYSFCNRKPCISRLPDQVDRKEMKDNK